MPEKKDEVKFPPEIMDTFNAHEEMGRDPYDPKPLLLDGVSILARLQKTLDKIEANWNRKSKPQK